MAQNGRFHRKHRKHGYKNDTKISQSHQPSRMVLRQVQMLHDSLQLSSGGLSRAKVVGRQISHEVQQLQKRMAQQERVLGGLAGCKRMPVDQWKLGRSEIS